MGETTGDESGDEETEDKDRLDENVGDDSTDETDERDRLDESIGDDSREDEVESGVDERILESLHLRPGHSSPSETTLARRVSWFLFQASAKGWFSAFSLLRR